MSSSHFFGEDIVLSVGEVNTIGSLRFGIPIDEFDSEVGYMILQIV